VRLIPAWPQIATSGFVKGAANRLFSEYAARRVRQLDRASAANVQRDTLLRLASTAANTRFGRDHGFIGIRSIADYQRRVPLRHYEAFWESYWQPAFPHLVGCTWPGRPPYLALSSGTTSGTTKSIPVTRPMLRSNRRAALTALAWLQAAAPDLRLFDGPLFFLGGSTSLEPAAGVSALAGSIGRPLTGDLSGIAAHEISGLLRPFTFPPLELALMTDWDRKLTLLAERSARLPITLVSGVPSWLLVLFERLKQVTGNSTVQEIWPSLRVVVHGGTSFAPYAAMFREQLGSDVVRFFETYPASEGFVAAEDPRYGLLRLIPDHGVFFEFVPAAELQSDRPTRHTVAQIEVGVNYAVVLTTCAGLWSYALGDTVRFERRDPPLLRFTGRTQQCLSAFGEHLVLAELDRALAFAAHDTAATATDYLVSPVFPSAERSAGHHRWLVEFAHAPRDLATFARRLDESLSAQNDDYRAHRQSDLTLRGPEVVPLPRGAFSAWMAERGQLGGQHKVPRVDPEGRLSAALTRCAEKLRLHPPCSSGTR
jgi:hypothetical protein